ncbi:hypothetical protein TNCV_3859791 [Trichonephila clavipes]|nr:hypothetical protein TNCV_3859791 [Trichonephila clavipes]
MGDFSPRLKPHSHQCSQGGSLSVDPIRDIISPKMKSLIGSTLAPWCECGLEQHMVLCRKSAKHSLEESHDYKYLNQERSCHRINDTGPQHVLQSH